VNFTFADFGGTFFETNYISFLSNYVTLSVVEGNFPNEMGKMSLPFKRQKGCVARVSNPRKGTA